MEYVSVLAGERFSDRPRCVDRRLAGLARAVNDVLGEAARPRLALLAPALIGTAATPTPSAFASSSPPSGPGPTRWSAGGRWWARMCSWLLTPPGVEVFAELELRRQVMGLADALIAAGQGEPARDAALIGLLAEAVAGHREAHQLPPAATAALLCRPSTPADVCADGSAPARRRVPLTTRHQPNQTTAPARMAGDDRW